MWRRRSWSRPALILFGALSGVTVLGCGSDSPEKAVYAVAHGIEMRDASELCGRVVAVGALPADLRPMAVAPVAMPAAEGCRRRFSSAAAFARMPLEGARVTTVRETGRTAVARVRGARLRRVALARPDDTWKVVVSGR